MKRRDAVTAFIASSAAPVALFAQTPGKVWRVGYLSQASGHTDFARAFVEGMRTLGYTEGQNISIDYRFSGDQRDRLLDLARELVQLKVDIIVADGSQPIKEAKIATSAIPIVMLAPSDPVGSGFVASLARPGGNVTGNSMTSTDLAAKDLQLVREFLPKATRVALLGAGGSAASGFGEQLQAATTKAGITLAVQHLTGPEVLASALAALQRERPQLLIVQYSTHASNHRKKIIEFAALHRLPAIYGSRSFVDAGGLISYGPNLSEMFRHAATFVDRIFKGAKPADLPVEQPTKYEMFINLKTAKALGIAIPQSLLLRADEVIQ